jgi:hypothetical protein
VLICRSAIERKAETQRTQRTQRTKRNYPISACEYIGEMDHNPLFYII